MSLELYIDPTPSLAQGRAFTPLFETSGEYARALQGLAGHGHILKRLPASIFLEIHAYEVLERMRDLTQQGSADPWWMPFWPASLFDAAGIATHPVFELQGMFPEFARTRLRLRHVQDFERAARAWIGRPHLSALAYRRSVLGHAERLGWEVIQP